MNRTVATLALLASSLIPATNALACGGFFCSSIPVDQSKERIIFGIDDEAGEVEVHVQIFYAGPAPEFAWVVPVPAVPDVGVSSDQMFNVVSQMTQPTFYAMEEYLGTCEFDWYYPGMEGDFGDAAAGAGGGAPSQNDGVTVVASAQVGPYDQVTLQASDAASLLTWLNDNGYQLPATIDTALEPYIADGSYFVALKLQNDRDAGDIAPIKMRYAGDSASIPLVLTSIAATPDMRLEPYVLTLGARAVPSNYLHVRINEAAVDWLGYGTNYDQLVTDAANEAGGQAFATDYSGSTSIMDGALYREGQFDLPLLRQTTHPADFVNQLLWQGFPRNTQMQDLIRAFIPMPAELAAQGVDDASFYNCLDCYRDALVGQDFDPIGFVDALDTLVITPLRESQALFDHFNQLTRLTSSMSPDEMTRDPLFVLNDTMADVSNVHTARLVVDCTNGEKYSEAARKIVLTDGTEIAVPPMGEYALGGGAGYLADLDVPAAAVIEQTGASGEPVTVSDNGGVIAAEVIDFNERVADEYGYAPEFTGGTPTAACGGCNGAGSAGGTWTIVGLLALGLRRRSR